MLSILSVCVVVSVYQANKPGHKDFSPWLVVGCHNVFSVNVVIRILVRGW